MHHDLTQQRQARMQLLPDPAREILAGGIFQSRDLVEIVMIEAVEGGLERGAHIGEVHYPAAVRIHRAADVYFDPEGMTMQARALVACRNVGQAMRGFNREYAEYVHAALRRRELEAQLQVPQVQRMEVQPWQTVKSTEPKWRRHCSQ